MSSHPGQMKSSDQKERENAGIELKLKTFEFEHALSMIQQSSPMYDAALAYHGHKPDGGG